MVKAVSNETFRLQLTPLARQVQTTGDPIGIHVVAGQPRYQLAPALDPARVQSCVRVGPDKFRQHIGEYRGLALFDDIPIGLVIHGELVAIFQRDPRYDPVVVNEVRAEFARRQGKPAADLLNRISVLEAAVERLVARLDDQSALIGAITEPKPAAKARRKKRARNADPGEGGST